MIHKFTCSVGLLLLTTNLFSQVPKIVPSSPEIYGLDQYGDIRANAYTWGLEISIPLHTVTVGIYRNIEDDTGNILQKYEYNYKGQ